MDKIFTFIQRGFTYGFVYWFNKDLRRRVARRIRQKRRIKKLSNRYKDLRRKFRKTNLKGKHYVPCNMCRIMTKVAEVSVDHIIAVSLGGKNERENLQFLCYTCHLKKTKTEEGQLSTSKSNN